MIDLISRRRFLKASACGLACGAFRGTTAFAQPGADFKVSLSERSLARDLTDGTLEHLDFAGLAKSEFGIDAVEYVSSFFSESVSEELLAAMNRRAAEHSVRQVLIRLDDQGNLANANAGERRIAIENHRRWIDVARTLGCHAIGVTVDGEDDPDDVWRRAVESLGQLADYAAARQIHVLVANADGPSADPQWLVTLIGRIDSPQVATLPDLLHFGDGDPAEGLQVLVPRARGVSAVTREFDDDGDETTIDYHRLMRIVVASGYQGHVGIEYQGDALESAAGVRATKALLDRVRSQLMEGEIEQNGNS